MLDHPGSAISMCASAGKSRLAGPADRMDLRGPPASPGYSLSLVITPLARILQSDESKRARSAGDLANRDRGQQQMAGIHTSLDFGSTIENRCPSIDLRSLLECLRGLPEATRKSSCLPTKVTDAPNCALPTSTAECTMRTRRPTRSLLRLERLRKQPERWRRRQDGRGTTLTPQAPGHGGD